MSFVKLSIKVYSNENQIEISVNYLYKELIFNNIEFLIYTYKNRFIDG